MLFKYLILLCLLVSCKSPLNTTRYQVFVEGSEIMCDYFDKEDNVLTECYQGSKRIGDIINPVNVVRFEEKQFKK